MDDCPTRARPSGTYTQARGDSAKQCVTKGKKTELIDPTNKTIPVIANQDIAKKNVGDYVEVSGNVAPHAQTITVDSLKILDSNHAMCDAPLRKKDHQKQP